MKVFLSWSGETSHAIARALNEWLPLVHEEIDPFMSAEGIDKGARWSTSIAKELEATSFGILCLTPDNVNAPWICFEAGASAKVIDQSRVAPLLFQLKPSDVQGPLAQFQVTAFEHEDFKRLIRSINGSAPDEAREEARLNKVVDVFWPELQTKIQGICAALPKKTSAVTPKPEALDKIGPILEEVLLLVRQQAKTVSDPTFILPPAYMRDVVEQILQERRHNSLPPNHPVWMDLARGWIEFRSRWLDAIPASIGEAKFDEIRNAFRELETPLEFVLRRGGRRFMHRTRGTPPSEPTTDIVAS